MRCFSHTPLAPRCEYRASHPRPAPRATLAARCSDAQLDTLYSDLGVCCIILSARVNWLRQNFLCINNPCFCQVCMYKCFQNSLRIHGSFQNSLRMHMWFQNSLRMHRWFQNSLRMHRWFQNSLRMHRSFQNTLRMHRWLENSLLK